VCGWGERGVVIARLASVDERSRVSSCDGIKHRGACGGSTARSSLGVLPPTL
jgi:hypothetical protein